jgi:hypothetical protein
MTHAKKLNVSLTSARRMVKELGGKSLVCQERPLSSDRMCQNQYDHSKILLNNLKSAPPGG